MTNDKAPEDGLRTALERVATAAEELNLAGGTYADRGSPDRERWYFASKEAFSAISEAIAALAATPAEIDEERLAQAIGDHSRVSSSIIHCKPSCALSILVHAGLAEWHAIPNRGFEDGRRTAVNDPTMVNFGPSAQREQDKE